MGDLAPHPRGGQVKEVLEGLANVVVKTGGAALLVVPALLPALLVYGGLQAVGRSLWSAGTRRKRIARAQRVLARPRFPYDELRREIAETTLRSETVSVSGPPVD